MKKSDDITPLLDQLTRIADALERQFPGNIAPDALEKQMPMFGSQIFGALSLSVELIVLILAY